MVRAYVFWKVAMVGLDGPASRIGRVLMRLTRRSATVFAFQATPVKSASPTQNALDPLLDQTSQIAQPYFGVVGFARFKYFL